MRPVWLHWYCIFSWYPPHSPDSVSQWVTPILNAIDVHQICDNLMSWWWAVQCPVDVGTIDEVSNTLDPWRGRLAHGGHAVAQWDARWHPHGTLCWECVAAQWNVRKCESGLVTQAFFSPSVLSGVDQSIFQSFAQHPHPHRPPMVMKQVIPPWSYPSTPYFAPDHPISLTGKESNSQETPAFGEIQCASCSEEVQARCHLPAEGEKVDQATQLDDGEASPLLDKLSHFWLPPSPPPHPAQEVTRPPSVEMENFARSKLTPRPPFGRARWEAVGVSGFCHRPWPLVAPGAIDGVQSSLSRCIPISTHCVCPV